MTRYIPLDALETEIERYKKEEGWCQVGKDTADVYYARGFRFACERIISFIDTSKVKEIDLEKELNDYGYYYDYVSLDRKELVDFAKHFLERGLVIQKGE